MAKQYYEIIKEFDCCGKHMITVKIGNAVHVMDYAEWQLVYGCNHQNRWNGKIDWNRFTDRKKYNQLNVS